MFDPSSTLQMAKLNEAVKASYGKLRSFRKTRRDLVKDYIGGAYGEANTDMPVNLLAQMIEIYLMFLAGRNPQVILPTARTDILPFVADLEAVVNQELEQMRFDKTLRKWVQEAMFSIGILKCGLVDAGYIELVPGQPMPGQEYFADIVDLDDFVCDMEAYDWSRITFIGDKYRIDYDQAMANKEFDQRAQAALRVREDYFEGDLQRTSNVGLIEEPSEFSGQDAIRRMTWVWDIALPDDGLLITMPHAQDVMVPLKVMEWDGANTHPYHILSFSEPPGHLMPLSPGSVVKSLNRSMNALYRKMVQQADRQKTLGLYRLGQEDDVKALQDANDGDLVGIEYPEMVNEVKFGGAPPESMAFSMHIVDLFKSMAGNLDALGGLGPQADTARQDAMIQNTVSAAAAKKQSVVTDAVVEVVRDLIYRIWTDPVRTYQARRTIPKTDIELAVTLPPDLRYGDLSDFSIKIEPYSLQHRSPRDRSNELIQVITQLAMPMLPMLQAQGITIDLQRLFEYLSKYMTLPELENILSFSGAPMPGTGEYEQQKPAVTHRSYERISRPGGSPQGHSQIMQQMLAGANPQPAQTATLRQPAGV